MIRVIIAWLFPRTPSEAERLISFYHGTKEARQWEAISSRALGARMLEISRHGL